MNFKDFEDTTLHSTDIATNLGKMWICDYRHNNIMEKPIRNIPPTEVIIVSNDDLPKGKNVYYSSFHFRPLGKNGEPKKQIIAPFDNTGFRNRTGDSVHIFFTEKECREFYVTQCDVIKNKIIAAKAEWMKHFAIMEQELDAKITKNM